MRLPPAAKLNFFSIALINKTVTKLSVLLTDGNRVVNSLLSPNSKLVVYRTMLSSDTRGQLLSVSIDGSTEERLHPTRTNGAAARSLGHYSADGQFVLLGFSYGLSPVEDVFIAAIDRSTPPTHVVTRSNCWRGTRNTQ